MGHILVYRVNPSPCQTVRQKPQSERGTAASTAWSSKIFVQGLPFGELNELELENIDTPTKFSCPFTVWELKC